MINQSPIDEPLDDLERSHLFNDKLAFVRKTSTASRYLDYGDVESQATESTQDRYFNLNGKRLSEEVEAEGIPIREANLLFIKAPKGCGKSVFINSILRPSKRFQKNKITKTIGEIWNPSVLVIVHRRSLAQTVAPDWGLVNYLDDDSVEPTHRYVTSIDSLWKLDGKPQRYEILCLDEIEQIWRHFLSETIDAKREQIFRVFVKLICEADQIICSDADLTSDLTAYLLSKLRGSFAQDRIISIVNEWKTDRAIEVYERKPHLIADLLCAVNDGKRVYVPVGHKKLANELKNLVELSRTPNGDSIRVLMLTGDTSEDEQAIAFFNDPNGESKKYSVLIATSTLSTGVSIDVKWFDAVYGIFDRKPYTYQDCDQAISRVRNCPVVKVWIHNGVRGQYLSEQAIRSGPVLKERLTRSLIGLDADGKMSKQDEQYMDVFARIMWCEQNWMQNRTEQFMKLKQGEGWTVIEVPSDDEMVRAGTEMLKVGRDPNGDNHYLKILQAADLDTEQFEELSAKKNLRGNDKHSVTKFWIAKTFDLQSPAHVTMNQIKAYFENGVSDVIRSAKLLKAARIDAIERDVGERTNPKNTKAFTSFGHRTMKRDILTGAGKVLGITYGDVLANAKLHVDNEAEFVKATKLLKMGSRPYRDASLKRNQQRDQLKWVITQDQIDNLAKFVNNDLDRVNLFFATNFKTPTAPETKMKVFNSIMGELGVTLKKKRKGKDDENPEYIIDYDRVTELVATKNLNDLI